MTASSGKTLPEDSAPQEAEPFLTRWSRRKEEARSEVPEPAVQEVPDARLTPPELPPIEELTLESDFRGFLHPKVSEDMRRAALKKLFSDPHFNVMDGLDVYIDDYSKSEPIPAAMLASMRQAQKILEWAKDDAEQRAARIAQQTAATPPALPDVDAAPGADNAHDLAEKTPASPDGPETQTKSERRVAFFVRIRAA